MTLTQLEYAVAIDTWRHFAKAAEHCFVTQPTLSMQIRKLEENLGLRIFDRARTPVVPTNEGVEIIAQARTVLREVQRISEIARERQGKPSGTLTIGIIPTLAPYLLPRFLGGFMARHPDIRLVVSELTTDVIVERLRRNLLDAGLLVTPLQEPGIAERHLFYEDYVVYVSPNEPTYRKRYVLADDIDTHRLWLLEEGHCMRSQIMRLCELKRAEAVQTNFQYEAGSVETLKKMVETRHGITIIPELALEELTRRQMKMVRRFRPPVPAREVSLVTHRPVVKQNLLDALQAEILRSIPPSMLSGKGKDVLKLAAAGK
jgi:LysR family hydrogen peroxide-inducible transcriptional activator